MRPKGDPANGLGAVALLSRSSVYMGKGEAASWEAEDTIEFRSSYDHLSLLDGKAAG